MSRVDAAQAKVLVALAWADGTVSAEEASAIRRWTARLELTPEEREEVEHLLDEPVPLDHFEASCAELRRLVASREERAAVVEKAARLVEVDGSIDREEARHLAALRAIMLAEDDAAAPSERGSEGGGSPLVSRARAALGGFGRRLRADGESLASSLRTLAGDLPGSSKAEGARTTPEERERVTLFGLLALRVVRAGGATFPADEARVRPALAEAAGVDEAGAGAILESMRHASARAGDRQYLCAAFNRVAPEEERRRLLRSLFAVARADGALSREEETEIRLIANYLWIEPQEFHRIRLDVAAGAA